jgi:UDP-glucose 4-epimerase
VRRALITGGAGFIGSTLADRLVGQGVEVAILDDFRTGRREFIEGALATGGGELFEGDILDRALLDRATAGCDAVFHLQANADVRHGLAHPRRDLEQNIVATSLVLEAMRAHDVKLIVFSSTGSVYGEPEVFPTPEDAPFPIQTSLYAASKLAGEGMIGAYCHGLGFTGIVCRFVSLLGERYTHGHVIDFYRALKRDPTRLRVLGDGRQQKSYLYVQDCITAMLTAIDHHAGDEGTFVYNLGTDETIAVDESVATITAHLGVSPDIEHTGGVRGWPGDSPLIHLDTSRLRALGWQPELSIREAIARTLDWFEREPGIVGIDQEAPTP